MHRLRGDKAIGTRKRGIGPSYAMRALRLTPRAGDLERGTFDLTSALAFYRTFMKKIPSMDSWMESAKASLKGLVGDVG
jgi:adenylosuccinate synthase